MIYMKFITTLAVALAADTDDETLRQGVMDKQLEIGVALNSQLLRNNDYETLAGTEFSLASAVDGCKTSNIAMDWDVFDFTVCDHLRLHANRYG